ncbi:MAG TPA: hypothetical protein PKX48_04555 [Planctomycetota bacterium]|jgi:hypothetical protein|nr:hypothetical protein [Planctomycetota bacterium]OQC19769.1 MAG: hypothetical protein BWX69_02436 [Planctomycetes bacterium ADurb.Bin069]NMD35597.1 hypothetical protein [Planctomycetota bacterium]HNR97741.1 hypothetical protein [Planctomycetota bacterium]HNU24792.1 hypothetical protein [Planctomycetota bacterium]
MHHRDATPPCRCPALSYDEWEGRRVMFTQKPFLTRRVPRAFGVSIGVEEEIGALRRLALALDLPLGEPPMVLERVRGFFRGELLLALGTDTGPENIARLDGAYLAAVHRGPHETLGAARARFVAAIGGERGVTPREIFYWYTDCPRCRDARGGPVTIILARIGASEA